MPKRVELFIEDCKLPSLNAINGYRWVAYNGRSRKARGYGKHLAGSKRWRTMIEEPLYPSHIADGHRIVTLVRLMGPGERPYDDDNLIGGFKALRDALVHHGYILNDGPRQATFIYKQEKYAQGPAIEIFIDNPDFVPKAALTNGDGI